MDITLAKKEDFVNINQSTATAKERLDEKARKLQAALANDPLLEEYKRISKIVHRL